mgnify:FL=1
MACIVFLITKTQAQYRDLNRPDHDDMPYYFGMTLAYNSSYLTGSKHPKFLADGVAFINAYTINPADQAMLFYRTNTGVYRSTDYGNYWEKINIVHRT